MIRTTTMRLTMAAAFSVAVMWGADAKTVDAVKAAERAWGAATASADEAALGKLLADDLSYTHSTGDIDTKAMFIGNMKSGVRKYHAVTYESVDARVYNGDAAAVTAVLTVTTSAKGAMQPPAKLRVLHLWVYQKGAWRLAAHQSLRMAN